MRSLIITKTLALALALAPGFAAAEDFQPAKFLADKCSKCHGTEVYTRENRRVKSLDKLAAQVRRCDANVGTALFDEDIETLVDYMNTTFYKF